MTDAEHLAQWLRDNPGEHRHPRIGVRLGWGAERYCSAFTEAESAGMVRQRGLATMGAPANAGVFVSLVER